MANKTDSQTQFEECVSTCAESMYRVAFRLTGNQTLASELVQETYLNAWKSLDSLKDNNRMRSWMFSILRYQYTKLLRRESPVLRRNSSEFVLGLAIHVATDFWACEWMGAAPLNIEHLQAC